MPSSSCEAARFAPPPDDWRARPGATVQAWPSEGLVRLAGRATFARDRGALCALDVGCGNGRHAVALARMGFGRVIAMDPVRDLLLQARQTAAEAGVGLETVQGSLPVIPIARGSVDLAVCWGVLFVLGGETATAESLAAVRAVLNADGVLIGDWRTERDGLRAFAGERIDGNTYRLRADAPSGLGGAVYSFWDLAAVRSFHAEAGFELISVFRQDTTDVMEDRTYSWWQTCARRR